MRNGGGSPAKGGATPAGSFRGSWLPVVTGSAGEVVKRSQWWTANFFTPPELAGAVTRELRQSGATRPELLVGLEMP
ncbi:MAG: hypothetical protein RLZZ117_534 [Cyanobacteriota bacterium]|jgi:hypothetical protein